MKTLGFFPNPFHPDRGIFWARVCSFMWTDPGIFGRACIRWCERIPEYSGHACVRSCERILEYLGACVFVDMNGFRNIPGARVFVHVGGSRNIPVVFVFVHMDGSWNIPGARVAQVVIEISSWKKYQLFRTAKVFAEKPCFPPDYLSISRPSESLNFIFFSVSSPPQSSKCRSELPVPGFLIWSKQVEWGGLALPLVRLPTVSFWYRPEVLDECYYVIQYGKH